MSNRSEQPVKLTSYSIKKQESLDTYLDEWQSIKQSRNSADSEEEKDEQGVDKLLNYPCMVAIVSAVVTYACSCAFNNHVGWWWVVGHVG